MRSSDERSDIAVTAAFGYLSNATAHIGGSIQYPGIFASGITTGVRWLTGNTSFIIGNSFSRGIVWQYTSVADELAGNSVPFDAGVYYQGAAPAVSELR
jgi:hypothetical protein